MAKRIKINSKTKPSSTRKKLVKEGNRKFIGPRTLRSVEEQHGADEDRNFGFGGPVPDRNYGKGNIRGGRFKEISQPDFESIGSERLKEILMNILYERGLRMPF